MSFPIAIEASEGDAKDAGSEVGVLMTLGKEKKSAVVDDEVQPSGALSLRPLDPVLPGLDVESRVAESQDGDPLAIELGDITQMPPSNLVTVEIMLLPEKAIEPIHFLRKHKPDPDSFEDILFRKVGIICHRPSGMAEGNKKI
jgi:hypothetical protein